MKITGQLIFIDDSGDPGFKLARGASRMFVIACVIFEDEVEAEYTGVSLKMLKKKLGWKQEREFKFHRATEEQKRKFFKFVRQFNFRIRAIVVDKTKVVEPKLKKDDSFYQKIILEVLNRFGKMKRASIYLDGETGKNYRNRSVAKIRQSLNRCAHRMTLLKLEDSKDSDLIQLADMVAGSIRVKYDPEKAIKEDYLALIADKIEDIYLYR